MIRPKERAHLRATSDRRNRKEFPQVNVKAHHSAGHSVRVGWRFVATDAVYGEDFGGKRGSFSCENMLANAK